jgi:hypothetical protein
MRQREPVPWEKLVEELRRKIEAAFERVADAIKNAMLDGLEEEPAGPGSGPSELPPLSRELFVKTLRGRVEEILGCVADAINQGSAEPGGVAGEERVGDLFAQLWQEALEIGMQMRLDAAVEELFPFGRPQGEWARRYRRMHAADAELTPLACTPPRN